mmetsp:Transcript_28507/g.50967  ORF Transcript_28507/g.50967 Transcript_28507/m.50967 type:complete len:590 (+) Transcript_28507:139-1908(+)|eukprot:CAMPEP_0115159572 /NCGR_PEP_ID=MMETSP0227-20121206/70292_1 /TAXON_ID=89957 /ORGANISM="Polarella glacialis, Strain CCMP 1383" /LENGTH=589 /DNA_ID=CAMNT_0002571309 /DNA_START=138 /DNA_END=1907 /DNA_ORIENTATION=+
MAVAEAKGLLESVNLVEESDTLEVSSAPRSSWKPLAVVAAAGLLIGGLASFRHLGGHRDTSTQSLRAATILDTSAGKASAIIDKIFADHGVGNEAGSYLEENQVLDGSSQTRLNSAYMCSSVDWYSVAHETVGLEDKDVQEQLKGLGVLEYCDPETGKAKDDATCKAVFAAIEARLELNKQIPEGPKMMAYMRSKWYADEKGHYASWGTSKDPHDILANTASGLCDIIRVVLNQANNQQGSSTCGPSAILASLIHTKPAQAIKVAMKLMWEGVIPGMPEAPCDYIYKQEPGMVPLKEKDCGHNPSADCLASSIGGHPMGLEGAFTQVAIASQVKAMNLKQGYYERSDVCKHDQTLMVDCPNDDCSVSGHSLECKTCGVAVHDFLKNDIRPEAMAQFTVPSQIMYMCDHVLGSGDGSCKYVFDKTPCAGKLDGDTCQKLAIMDGLTGDDAKTYLEYMATATATGQVSSAYHIKATLPAGKTRTDKYMAMMDDTKEDMLIVLKTLKPKPLSDKMIEQICNAKYAIIQVESDALQVKTKIDDCSTAQCKHWVILETQGCKQKEGKVEIWSWAQKYEMPFDYLKKCVCGAVIL